MRRIIGLGSLVMALGLVGCGSSGTKAGTGGAGGNSGSGGALGGDSGGAIGSGGATQSSFSISTNPAAVMLPASGSQSIPVTINRNAGATTFNDPITLSLTVPSAQIGWFTGAFTPNPATAGGSSLALSIGDAAAPGIYQLSVVATAGTLTATSALPVTVTPPATTLLVDGDYSDNNGDVTNTTLTPSVSDALFSTLLKNEGVAFNTFVVPTPSGVDATTPAASTLASYSTIVWYTGDAFDDPLTLSAAQQAILEGWLDAGGHTLLLFSENLVFDIGVGDWTLPETNTFLKSYIGAAGDADDGDLNHFTYAATGAASTVFTGEVFQIVKDTLIDSTADPINPAAGTDTLVTAMEDPSGAGTAIAVPVTVGRKAAGAAGTSQVVYVGLPIEDIVQTSVTSNQTSADFFHAVLRYVGLKAQ
jgi:hypothetical protein